MVSRLIGVPSKLAQTLLVISLSWAMPADSACSRIYFAGMRCDIGTPPQGGIQANTRVGWDSAEPIELQLFIDGTWRASKTDHWTESPGTVEGHCGDYSYQHRYTYGISATEADGTHTVQTKTLFSVEPDVWSNEVVVIVDCE